MDSRTLRPALGALALILAAAASAQLEDPQPKRLIGMRQLALSPDGARIAFTYRGDIWIAPSAGGLATPVTNHVEYDQAPIWSPDGKWIAFASNRFGNEDIFVVPSGGGTPRRLTWHSGADVATDWSPDGKFLALSTQRDSEYPGLALLDIATGRMRIVAYDQFQVVNPQFATDGKSLVYMRQGFPWMRPRYEGSKAAQLWRLDIESGKRTQLRATGFQHLWPRIGPDGRVFCVTVTEKTPSSSPINKSIGKFVDNVDRTPNVYEVTGGRARRVSEGAGAPARFLSVAERTGAIAFERDGEAYVMQPGGKAIKAEFFASVDDKTTNEERLVLTGGAGAMTADGKVETLAFVARDEIWTVPVKQEKGPNASDARQLTDWPGLDADPLLTPDGKTLFFTSDREGSQRLYRMDLATKAITPISEPGRDVTGEQIRPDGNSLSYWQTGPEGGLYVLPFDGQPKRVIPYAREFRFGTFPESRWSPDGRYVAYVKATRGVRNVWVYDALKNTEVNVTRLAVENSQPAWTPDGKYLLFYSDRSGPGVYAIPLKVEDARLVDTEIKYVKPAETPKVEIDFTDIERRIRKIGSQRPESQLEMDLQNGDVWFVSEGDLWKMDYTGENLRRMTSGGGVQSFYLTPNAERAVFLRNGSLNLMAIRSPQYPVTNVPFRADWTRDIREERRAAMAQFWREYNRFFYDPNFHGRDWGAIRKRYEPLLDGVGHRNEMALVLFMMVGELEASHSEVGPGGGNPPSAQSAHPGFTFDYRYQGQGIRVLEVPEGTPGSFAKTRVKPGEYVLEINGKPVVTDEALWRDVLNDQVGREIKLLVSATPSKNGAREVKYRALSGGEFGGLLDRNRIEARRKYVEEKSGGKLAYIYIAGMGQGNLQQFNREAWEFIRDKEGVIIDVRDNGGGNISDDLIDQIERKPDLFYKVRDGEIEPVPGRSWNLPTVVMHNENSASNAEMFPSSMRYLRLAKLVGMPTPGYVIATVGLPLVDGTSARMPFIGVFRIDGSNMENNGEKPDYQLEIPVEDYLAGRDPQLDRAIEVALDQVRGN